MKSENSWEAFPSPCYILDISLLRRNVEILRRMKEEIEISILLSLKGFALWRVFDIIELDGASTSSLWEARLAYEKMKCKVHHYGVAYDASMVSALSPYVRYMSFNSLSQAKQWAPALSAKGISCGLRINAEHKEVAHPLYDTSSSSSRLGVTRGGFSALPSCIEGLHIHALCENDHYALERLLKAVERKFGHLFSSLAWLNLGGGHLLTDKAYDISHAVGCLKAFQQKYPHISLILEPSAAVVWQAGVLKATIWDIVENGGVQTAILNISFSCHMPDCLEMPYRPHIRGSRSRADASFPHAYRMGGLSCLAGDVLGAYYFEHPLSVGQTLIFEDMMHYTFVKSTFFNGLSHPSFALLHEDGRPEVLRSFDYEDYKKRLG